MIKLSKDQAGRLIITNHALKKFLLRHGCPSPLEPAKLMKRLLSQAGEGKKIEEKGKERWSFCVGGWQFILNVEMSTLITCWREEKKERRNNSRRYRRARDGYQWRNYESLS